MDKQRINGILASKSDILLSDLLAMALPTDKAYSLQRDFSRDTDLGSFVHALPGKETNLFVKKGYAIRCTEDNEEGTEYFLLTTGILLEIETKPRYSGHTYNFNT